MSQPYDPDREIRQLIGQLAARDPRERQDAAAALGTAREKARPALRALAGLLQDEDPLTRVCAASSIRMIDRCSQLPDAALTKELTNEDVSLRRLAAKALYREVHTSA
jgi:HEAT repeat protein